MKCNEKNRDREREKTANYIKDKPTLNITCSSYVQRLEKTFYNCLRANLFFSCK